jgi:Putative lumazine-binding
MKNFKFTFALLLVALVVVSSAFNWYYSKIEAEKDTVKAVVEEGYIQGIHVKSDMDLVRKNFHEDFMMFALKEGKVKKISIQEWIERIEKKKAEKAASAEKPKEVKTTHKFKTVDVVGNTAVVKVELFKDNLLTFTDYLSLYKTAEGWKIVGKVFNYHESPTASTKK